MVRLEEGIPSFKRSFDYICFSSSFSPCVFSHYMYVPVLFVWNWQYGGRKTIIQGSSWVCKLVFYFWSLCICPFLVLLLVYYIVFFLYFLFDIGNTKEGRSLFKRPVECVCLSSTFSLCVFVHSLCFYLYIFLDIVNISWHWQYQGRKTIIQGTSWVCVLVF